MAPIYKALMEGGDHFEAKGTLRMHVHVNSAGKATKVDFYETPSDEMTQFAARIAMRTKFKPAVCAGNPCAMQFPLALHFD